MFFFSSADSQVNRVFWGETDKHKAFLIKKGNLHCIIQETSQSLREGKYIQLLSAKDCSRGCTRYCSGGFLSVFSAIFFPRKFVKFPIDSSSRKPALINQLLSAFRFSSTFYFLLSFFFSFPFLSFPQFLPSINGFLLLGSHFYSLILWYLFLYFGDMVSPFPC